MDIKLLVIKICQCYTEQCRLGQC